MTKLNAKVTSLRSGSQSANGQQRAELTVTASPTLEQVILIDNPEGWALDEELVLLVTPNGEAVRLYEAIASSNAAGLCLGLLDQLRPDPLPEERAEAANA